MRPWDNLWSQIRRQHCALNLLFTCWKVIKPWKKFGGRFSRGQRGLVVVGAKRGQDRRAFSLIVKSLNRFYPNVTFIIFEQLISLDKTQNRMAATPPSHFTGGWREQGRTQVNLQTPAAVEAARERRERCILKSPADLWTPSLVFGLNRQARLLQCALWSRFWNALLHFKGRSYL